MKVSVKTLKGTHFDIQVNPEDSIADVKKNIETVQGSDVYPAAQQMLIYQGKVLKDSTSLDENKVVENSFIVVMLTKASRPAGEGSTTPSAASTTTASRPAGEGSTTPSAASTTTTTTTTTTVAQPRTPPRASSPQPPAPTSAPPAPAPTPASVPVPSIPAVSETNVYGQAASNLVAGNILEETVQQIIDMGGGTWDRDTVIRALRAAFNNPERAVEYLYSGIPEQAEVPLVARPPVSGQPVNPLAQPAPPAQPAQTAPVPSTGPNANPLNLFPQGLPAMGTDAAGGGGGTLDFLRNSQQFQALRAMVQANPQILQPMLQELGKQNPHLMRQIQEHQADFLRLINEPVEGGDEGNPLAQLGAAVPQTIAVTPEEREAIQRLEAMGFERTLVLEVYFACNKNEEMAANYLLDHMHEFEE